MSNEWNSASQPAEKSGTAAVLLSLIMTGIGQIYAGALERGLVMLVIYLFLCGLAFGTGVFFIFLIPYWIWGMFDASSQAEKFNARIRSAKNEIATKEAKAAEVASTTTSASEFVSQIEKLSKLHASGILEESEYTAKKASLINSLMTKKPRESAEDFLSAIIPLIERKQISGEETAQIKRLFL